MDGGISGNLNEETGEIRTAFIFLGSKCKPIYNSSIERLSRGENRRRIRVYVFHNGWVKNKRVLSRVDFLEN